MPKNVQNAYSGPQWDMRKYFKGRTPPSLFSSYKSGTVGGFSHWLSFKIILYWSHLVPSLSYSKKSSFTKIWWNPRIYPSSKIEIFDRWEFLQYGHMIHHWNRNEVIHKCFFGPNPYHWYFSYQYALVLKQLFLLLFSSSLFLHIYTNCIVMILFC